MSEVSFKEFVKPFSEALGRTEPPNEVAYPSLSTTLNPHSSGGLASCNTEELLQAFLDEAHALGIEIAQVEPAEVGRAIVCLAENMGSQSVIYASAPEAQTYNLAQLLEQAGIAVKAWDNTHQQESIRFAEAADLGITFAYAGIAETATVAQICDEHSGRAVCLMPKAHIAVLHKSSIVPYMLQLMGRLREEFGSDLPSNVAFITGPSSTADIELVRVVGVHGPVSTGIVIVDD